MHAYFKSSLGGAVQEMAERSDKPALTAISKAISTVDCSQNTRGELCPKVSCGVFSRACSAVDGLRELPRVARPSGLIVVSTRKSYAEAISFDDQMRRLQDAGILCRHIV